MNKALKIILNVSLLGALAACHSGNGKTINQKGANVFPVSTIEDTISITMGDVMPFYDNGRMNIYHLRNVSDSNPIFYHPISRISTTDFIHYQDDGIALNYEKEIDSIDAALGTGSFIKDNDGKYHCFYTGHNGQGQQLGLKYNEAVRHATSLDQVSWTKDENFTLFGYENDFRDPYVYYDTYDSCYYMLITTRDYGNAVIKRYQSSSLDATAEEWVFKDNFFTNTEGDYNMECPSFVEYGNYFYLAYSEQGDNRVTHYRYKTSHDGEWLKFERDAIDSDGFYAGRMEKAEDKLYAFAWCARLTGGNTGSFDWAGNLVSHELKQDEATGELHAVMPHTYKEYFSHKMPLLTVDNKEMHDFEFSGEKFEAVGMKKNNENVNRFSMKLTPLSSEKDFGVSFGLDGNYNNRLGSGLIAFDVKNSKIVCYNNVSSILRYGNPLTSIDYDLQENVTYDVDIIADGEVLTVYINDDAAMTARITDMKENNFAFYSNGAKAKISEVERYE